MEEFFPPLSPLAVQLPHDSPDNQTFFLCDSEDRGRGKGWGGGIRTELRESGEGCEWKNSFHHYPH